MNLIQFVRQLLERLKLESPDFYKKLQLISGVLVALFGVVIAGNEMFDWGLESIHLLKMPLTAILNILTGFLTGIFAVSFTPVRNPSDLTANK